MCSSDLLLGLVGCLSLKRRLWTDARCALIVLAGVAPLVLFSTSVAVYDGERLFLPSFLSWAVLAGVGGDWLYSWLKQRVRRPALVLGALILMPLVEQYAIAPYWLSYYGQQIGGLRGAARCGFF